MTVTHNDIRPPNDGPSPESGPAAGEDGAGTPHDKVTELLASALALGACLGGL